MTDDNGTEPQGTLDRAFAGMLGELEDAETKLVQEQAKLAKELDRVSGELDRLQVVKAAMLGKPKPSKRAARSSADAPPRSDGGNPKKTADNRKRVLQWVRTLEPGSEFTGGDVADALGIPSMGTGPILTGMSKAGMLKRREEHKDGRMWRYYSLPIAD